MLFKSLKSKILGKLNFSLISYFKQDSFASYHRITLSCSNISLTYFFLFNVLQFISDKKKHFFSQKFLYSGAILCALCETE